MRKTILGSLLLLALSFPAAAGSIALEWNPVPGATGYKVHYGRSPRNYTNVVTLGNVAEYTVQGLADCTTYHVAVTAFDGQGNQSSAYSNEVSGWSRPRITGTVVPNGGSLTQGEQSTLQVQGANFVAGADLVLDAAQMPVDMLGNELVRVDNVSVQSCDQIQALVSVEAMGRGMRAMEVGAFPMNLEVRNPDSVFGESTRTIQIAYNEERSDINRTSTSTRDRVDGKDLIWLAHAHGSREGDAQFNPDADLNGDGEVDGDDLAFLSPSFGLCWNGSTWRADACN